MEECPFSIRITNGVSCSAASRMASPINLCILPEQQIAIVGPNGSGKSMLVNTMLRQYPLMDNCQVEYGNGVNGANIRFIAFRDSYGSADSTYFYQQRWNSTEMGESPLVKDAFSGLLPDSGLLDRLVNLFMLDKIWDKQLVTLSSGEMRKYQLAKSLLVTPKVLILDSPFIGLDAETRSMLCSLLDNLIEEWKMQIIIVVSRDRDIPDFITHVIPVSELHCRPTLPVKEYFDSPHGQDNTQPVLDSHQLELLESMPDSPYYGTEIVKCNNVSLKYGSRCILDKINWTVMQGDRWVLLGPNGSGKSALLSLIYADNPQAYSQDITLFGSPRGSGESIWEIKKHIGYVSPEMHRSYSRHYPSVDIVASGLYDTIGLYKKITQEEKETCRIWLEIFGMSHLSEKDFACLSSGEQRMILLARAFVKNPSLVILDEPLHGLDNRNRAKALEIIRVFTGKPGKTLIIVTHYPEELDLASLKEITLCRH